MTRTHLVSHRADTTNAGGDVRHFVNLASLEKALKETRRFVNIQLDMFHLISVEPDV